jgi:hypothetical protein
MSRRLRLNRLLAAVAALCAAGWVAAAEPEVIAHPWAVPPPTREPEAYFTNVRDGDEKEAPFVLRFGLSMRGLVPAGNTADRAGHHHLLVNQPLPLEFRQPLPFTEKYIHFGKGQMEHVVDLPPGTYTFNLLLADKGHIPYFVYSKPVRITIKGRGKQTGGQLGGVGGVEFLYPAPEATLRGPLRVQFHAVGFNVAHASPALADTGHFRLVMTRAGQPTQVLDFRGGQTETWLNPPRGEYQMRVELVSNKQVDRVMAASPTQRLVVGGGSPL